MVYHKEARLVSERRGHSSSRPRLLGCYDLCFIMASIDDGFVRQSHGKCPQQVLYPHNSIVPYCTSSVAMVYTVNAIVAWLP